MSTFQTSRQLPANPTQVFAAFADPQRLARWWGPAGFRNTFEVCDFRPGGAWTFTMHGPDGSSYPNASVFTHIDAPRQVVIDHICAPLFRLTVDLQPVSEGSTQLTWTQVFADPAVAAAVRAIVEPANEQNLDRLAAELART